MTKLIGTHLIIGSTIIHSRQALPAGTHTELEVQYSKILLTAAILVEMNLQVRSGYEIQYYEL